MTLTLVDAAPAAPVPPVTAEMIFLAAGWLPADVRPEMPSLADGMQSLLDGGFTPERCQALTGLPDVRHAAPSPRCPSCRRPGPWATPGYCSACHQNHPGACGCPCHLPARGAS